MNERQKELIKESIQMEGFDIKQWTDPKDIWSIKEKGYYRLLVEVRRDKQGGWVGEITLQDLHSLNTTRTVTNDYWTLSRIIGDRLRQIRNKKGGAQNEN